MSLSLSLWNQNCLVRHSRKPYTKQCTRFYALFFVTGPPSGSNGCGRLWHLTLFPVTRSCNVGSFDYYWNAPHVNILFKGQGHIWKTYNALFLWFPSVQNMLYRWRRQIWLLGRGLTTGPSSMATCRILLLKFQVNLFEKDSLQSRNQKTRLWFLALSSLLCAVHDRISIKREGYLPHAYSLLSGKGIVIYQYILEI